MATYVLLLKFTEQGIHKIKETRKRAESFRAMAGKAGAKVNEVYWTLGQYDGLLILEAPDEATAAALGLSLGSLGNVRPETLRAFSSEEIGGVLKKRSESSSKIRAQRPGAIRTRASFEGVA